jgi:hypothetical protein
MANKFLTGITIATAVGGEYTFPIADGSANQAIITDGNGNLSFGSAIASTAEDAQRLVCEMINNSGSTIGAFLPVCCVGIHSDGTPEIAPARSDNPLYMPAIGITQSSVGNNNRTDILLYGKLEDIDTTDYETGDTLYVAATGGWSTTRPTGNNLIQAVFKVGRIQQNNGSGGAFGTGQYEDLPNIGEGKVWIGDSSSYPVATSLSTAIPAALGYTPVTNARTLTINDVTYDLSADRSWTIEAGGTSASTRTIQKFTSTSNQTTFTITGGYTVGMVDVWVNGSKLDNAVDFTASNGTTVVLTDALTANQIVEVYKYGSQFIVNNGLRQKTLFTATSGQTSFTVAYSVGLVDVFYNGSKLDDSEFTATNGTSIVLGTACAVNDKVEVIAFSYNVNGFTGIGGSGTTNNLPKFTAAGTIGDSAITDNGTTVTLVSRALSGTSATFTSTLAVNGAATLGTGASSYTFGGGSSAAGGLTDKDLTLKAWSPTSGTNEYSGDLILQSGVGTGNGSGKLGSVIIKAGTDGSTSSTLGTYSTIATFTKIGLGIGLTPFANTLSNSLDLVNGGGLFAASNNFYVTGNAYFDSAWKYKANGGAAFINLNSGGDGSIGFVNAASGSAGANISFTEKMKLTNAGSLCINTTLVKSRLGSNTKFTVAGSGSNAAGNSGASMGAVAGTGSAAIDTGIDIEATDGGLTLLFLASRNTSGGTNTASAVYIISFYYSGTFPVVTYLGGTSNFVTFGQSGTVLTATNAIGYGNFNCSWFASK